MIDSASLTTIAHLPSELYSAILNHVPLDLLQTTTVAFARALPRSPIPQYHVYQYVRLTHHDQILALYQHLRKNTDAITRIKAFSLETWITDADVVVNLMRTLSSSGTVRELRMFIGLNFAPEHLEEIFENPWKGLQYLSIRFRPYVQRAIYYQFLKGAYFDSTLMCLSRWQDASCEFPTLSIIQDPLDPSIAPTGQFAQPLVFFRLDPFKTLSTSSFVAELKHFRLRIPSRQVSRFIYALPNSLPALEYLDLSTCNVVESDVESILGRFGKLMHLVLDGCSVVSQRTDLSEDERQSIWVQFGKGMALAGVKLAKEREKKLKIWQETNGLQTAMNALHMQEGEQPVQPRQRRIRRGRRGLATATISLRDSPPRDPVPLPRTSNSNSSNNPPRKIRILPPQAFLHTFATNAPGYHKSAKERNAQHNSIRMEFERGWAEGTAQLAAIRARLLRSWQGGMQVVAFRHHHCFHSNDDYEDDVDVAGEEYGLQGLIDVHSAQEFAVTEDKCPVLCLAGSGRRDAEGHVEGCGHTMGWDIWQDEL